VSRAPATTAAKPAPADEAKPEAAPPKQPAKPEAPPLETNPYVYK
jgi:hypothetical protein